MQTRFFKLFAITLLITFVSCKKETSLEYKYADSPKVLACDFPKGQLYNEAVYSFEKDIANLYDKKGQSVSKAYSQFVANALNGRVKIEDLASEHSFNIAMALKEDTAIWNMGGKDVTLNYSAPFTDCIANNIKMSGFKTTFNSLLATNSMRPLLILTPLRTNARQIQGDGSLKTFIAFEYYYAKLMNMDPTLLKKQAESAKNDKVDFNKTPKNKPTAKPAEKKDAHAGHNH